MTAAPHVEPYPGREGRSGEKVQVTVSPGGMLSAPRPPKVEGYRCTFVAHYAPERTVYTYRRTKAAA
jgi:hypothetical protein